ncbi:ABC transporter permease [Arthrobacter psychrochitiniphilus]|uniref:Transport permease protein n=1 Tax=Arthrobacter psychrochitiniphilus TaxID=291045 RepID=A0A2V3DMS1_9MICC|nr:ABC transporter permease [Arthrobacter psychrochitiniphilus]NYG18058.1 teichoic acid transport system permease protein [Arthrobacter psychrochitiniphilus]PXA64220.1 phosphate ABC transporter permease [Arthrobacter psychrochitiniphilus]
MTQTQENVVVPAAAKILPVNLSHLSRVGARPAFLDYLVQLWDFRSFIIYDARARVKSGTRRDKLGSAWLLLNPIFNGVTYFVIFGLLLGTGNGIPNFIGYLTIGIFMFQMTSGAITGGARSIQQNRALVQGFTFPRAALPLGVNIREAMVNVPMILAMLLLVLVIPPTEPITWRWLLIIPVLLLQFLFNLGVGMALARVISRVNDVSHLLPFALRALMYLSAIFFSYERFIQHPVLLSIMQANPMFIIIDITRDCLLYGVTPALQSWVVLTAWSLSALIIGSVYFWKGEESYVRG